MSRPVLEVADIVRQHGDAFLARYGSTLSGRDFLRVVNFSSFLSNGLPSAVFP